MTSISLMSLFPTSVSKQKFPKKKEFIPLIFIFNSSEFQTKISKQRKFIG